MNRIYILIILIFFTEEIFSQQIKIDTIQFGYEIEITIPLPEFKVISQNDSIPLLDNSEYIYEKTAPELLKMSQLFQVFTEKGLKAEILIDSIILINTSIAPSLGFLYQNEKIPNRIKGKNYQIDEFYPKEIIKSFSTVQHRNQLYQNFWIHFMQYNPVKKQLLLHKYLKIRFSETNFSAKAKKHTKEEIVQEKMLIFINDSMKTALFPFIQWKKQLGIDVFTEYLTAKLSSAVIKSTITNYYQNQEINYVLLVGDNEQIPTNSSNYGPSDYAYTTIFGNDVYSDVMIGRFPADNNSELSAMIAKSISFEKAIYTNEKPMTVGGIASAEGGSDTGDNGESDFQHIKKINQVFKTNGFDSLLIVEDLPSENSVSELFTKSNYLFYTGHGDENGFRSVKFTNDSVNLLQNNYNHPILIDAACLNGNFVHTTDCMAEYLMKAHTNSVNFGTTAVFASTISQLWAPPMLGQDVFTSELFSAESNKKIGDIATTMFFELISKYNTGGIETVYTWTLFGDPSLNLWNISPQSLTVSAPEYIDVSSDYLTIEANNGSLVTLVNDTTILAKAIAENGKAILQQGALPQIDSVFLTVYKPQHQPYIKVLKPYTEAGSYYSIINLSFEDENNNIPENAEWITIKPQLVNYGKQIGNNIKITVSEAENLLEFDNNEVIIESIEGNSSVKEFSFKIRTKEFLSDKETIKLQFKMEDKNGQINQKEINFEFFAPIPSLLQIAVNENWNASENIVTNDTLTISAVLTNSGHAPLYNSTIQLMLNDVFVETVEKEINIEELSSMKTDTFKLQIVLNPSCYKGHKFQGSVVFQDNDSLVFSFLYKENPNLEIGNKEFSLEEFPFYNYYKSNKSQMLYTAEMLRNKPLRIDSIGFYLSKASRGEIYGNFSNFQIKMLETDINELNYNYENIEDSEIIFAEDVYTLPSDTGLFFIDIDDFQYAGIQNLLLEMSWGFNTAYSSYNNSFEVHSSGTDYNSSVYGYSDTNNPPEYRGNANYLPDIYLATHATDLLNVDFSLQLNENISEQDVFYLKIGENSKAISLNEIINYQLPIGSYPYRLLKYSNLETVFKDTLELTENNQTEIIEYNKNSNNIENSYLEKLDVFYSNKTLNIRQNDSRLLNYYVYNILGNKILSGFTRESLKFIPFSQNAGIYLIRIENTNQKRTFKILVH